MELEEVVKLLVEREGWENVCVVCCSFVDAVCKTTAAFHRPGARERLLASMISSVHSVMKYRNLSMPTLRGALLMSRA